MLLVQKFLSEHTFGDLERDHGVTISFSKSGHKWSLNYDLLSKDDDPLAQECRGLILACEDGRSLSGSAKTINGRLNYDDVCPGKTIVLAFPMRRFFNFGQSAAAKIDFSDPETVVQVKADGSLCIIYVDPFIATWCCATRSCPDADIIMDNGLFTFGTLFEKALFDKEGTTFAVFCSMLDPNNTYCFELMTNLNKIVVDYKENNIIFLMARNNSTLEEVPLDEITGSFDLIGEIDFNDYDKIVEYINSFPASEMEGVVVKDKFNNRVKIKSNNYVLAHRMKDHVSASPRNCMDVILSEQDDDVLPLLPKEIADNLLKMKDNVRRAIKDYDLYYEILLNSANTISPGDKKTFALMVTANKQIWSAPLFQRFLNKASSMKDFVRKNKKNGSFPDSFLDKMLEISNQS